MTDKERRSARGYESRQDVVVRLLGRLLAGGAHRSGG
jgi:hypothetical protein